MSQGEEWGHGVGWGQGVGGAGEDTAQGLGTCGAGAGRLGTENMGTATGKRDTGHRAAEGGTWRMGPGEWARQGQQDKGGGMRMGMRPEIQEQGSGDWSDASAGTHMPGSCRL